MLIIVFYAKKQTSAPKIYCLNCYLNNTKTLLFHFGFFLHLYAMSVIKLATDEFILIALQARNALTTREWTPASLSTLINCSLVTCTCTPQIFDNTDTTTLEMFLYLYMCNIKKHHALDIAFVLREARESIETYLPVLAANAHWWTRTDCRKLDGLVHMFITMCLPSFSTFMMATRVNMLKRDLHTLHVHAKTCRETCCETQCGIVHWTCSQYKRYQNNIHGCMQCNRSRMCNIHTKQCQLLLSIANVTDVLPAQLLLDKHG